MNIYFIQYECVPVIGSENETEYGGAFISGWILSNGLDNAKAIYQKSVQELGWLPSKLEEAYEFDSSLYKEGDESLEFYNQSKIDGEAYCADCWPNEPQDNEKLQ